MGLRTFLVGDSLGNVLARLKVRSELEVLPVVSAEQALASIDGSAPAIVLLPVEDPDLELASFANLVARGAQVVVLAQRATPGLRVAAFSAGVTDVLFPPHEPWFVEETVLVLAGNPLRRDVRVPSQIEALVVPIGGVAMAGNLVSLSMGEMRARLSGSISPGAILRVALRPPEPYRLPVFFARTRSIEPLEDGRIEIRARLVGMTAEEQALLGAFLEHQPAEVEDVAAVLAAIESLDAEVLRGSEGSLLAGLTIPKLSPPELAWVRAAPGTADAALADVAVARCRAELTASLLESVGADLITLAGLPLERYLDEIHRAKRAVAAAIELFRKSDASVQRELATLQGRLHDAASTLERIATEIAAAGPAVSSLDDLLDGTLSPEALVPLDSDSPTDPGLKPPAERKSIDRAVAFVLPPTEPEPVHEDGELELELDEGEPVEDGSFEDASQTRITADPEADLDLMLAKTQTSIPFPPPESEATRLPTKKRDTVISPAPVLTGTEVTPPPRPLPDPIVLAKPPAPVPPPPAVVKAIPAAPAPKVPEPGVAGPRTGSTRKFRNPFLEE